MMASWSVHLSVSQLSGPGLSPGWRHCVVFLGKTLYSYSTSLHPGVEMGTGKFDTLGVTLQCTSIPFRGESRNTPSHFMLLKTG